MLCAPDGAVEAMSLAGEFDLQYARPADKVGYCPHGTRKHHTCTHHVQVLLVIPRTISLDEWDRTLDNHSSLLHVDRWGHFRLLVRRRSRC
jgi:hypothetical protein